MVGLQAFPQPIDALTFIVQDATELIAKLRAYHFTAQTKPDKAALAHSGLDLVKGCVRNNVEAGVLESSLSKIKMIQV